MGEHLRGDRAPSGVRLLLVEDDAPVRRSLQLLLRGCGYDVRAYADGRRVLVDPAAQEVMCLITDHQMASIDGISLLRALRALGWSGVAILLTATHASLEPADAGSVGFELVIEKPVDEHSLIEVVRRSLSRM
ncbi:response regulator [Sphingomonas sp. TDK1]|uniref:response regulator n=1 Tax=Sphingomonas sp. TDK1 TaxID=453247 RepID=UPI0007DA09C9|nr:response regulator [Sphingomonas sp. TDK1]OAN64926.1 hypothetical protein A7X12_16240 [Sphingomonas sp. TDK1]